MSVGRSINSQTSEWCTPKKYVDLITKFFGTIELDPCYNMDSLVLANNKFIYPNNDGLHECWNYNSIYINPPYGKGLNNTTIKDWFKKAYEAYIKYDSEVIMLVPVATNTRHWKDYVYNKACSICFLSDTRVKFRINGNENNKGSPMSCCFIYYGNRYIEFRDVMSVVGNTIQLKDKS